MKLIELLAPERVVVPLEAATLREAATVLLDTLVASGAAADAARLRQHLEERLPREAAPIGPATLLLHFRSDAVPKLMAALGVAPRPVRQQGEERREGRIVILVVAPPRESSLYLQAVSVLGRVLAREAVVQALLSAASPEDVLRAAPLADIELPGYLTVRDIMVPRQVSVRPEATLGEASQLMVAHDIHALPVVSETGEVLGMITHRELLRHLLPQYVKRMSSGELRKGRRGSSDASDPHQIPVREVMDRTVLCVSEDQTLADVATTMINRNVDRFPVVREGKLSGFLTRADIVRRLLGR